MLSVRRLVWNPGNVAHIARHKVKPDDVEEVCHTEPVAQMGKFGRLLVLGPTQKGRILTIVLDATETPGVYYVVTARPSSRQERRIYSQRKGGR
ncbi:MAG: BrnT family toxin [Chloroflexi bacterium]|nr:BrnT family toxin [Chloroflexota bacterium]